MSKRDIRRLNKIHVERQLRDLDLEKERLYDAQSNLGWLELGVPIRDGWEKSLTLREDYLARSDSETYLRLLKIINQTVTSHNKNFMKKNWRTKQMEVIHATPKDLGETQFEKDVPEDLKKFFTKIHKVETTRWGTYERDIWIVSTPWIFVEKISRHYITKVKVVDSDIDSRLQEIENHIEKNGLKPKYYKMKGWPAHHDRDYNERRFKLIDKISKKELEDVDS